MCIFQTANRREAGNEPEQRDNDSELQTPTLRSQASILAIREARGVEEDILHTGEEIFRSGEEEHEQDLIVEEFEGLFWFLIFSF